MVAMQNGRLSGNRGGRKADKDLVRAVALDVLGQHGIERAPVDPLAIAKSLGIVVQSSDKLEGCFSGCLLRAGASFGILYSTGIRNKGYQRFTVAHELGHFSLSDHHRVLFEKGALHRSESGFSSGVWYEQEADLFGVELLIPEFLFHKHRREFATGLDGVKGLAELFQTSLTATGIRYASLCTEAVAVVVSEGDRFCTPSCRGRSYRRWVCSRGSGGRRGSSRARASLEE